MMYEYECPRHGKFEIICSVKEHQNPYPCPKADTEAGVIHAIKCTEMCDQLFSARVFMQPDIWDNTYVEALNVVVNSKAGLEEAMAQTHSRRWEAGMDKDAERAKEYKQEREDRERQKIIEKTLEEF